jgi:hypothetical protein
MLDIQSTASKIARETPKELWGKPRAVRAHILHEAHTLFPFPTTESHRLTRDIVDLASGFIKSMIEDHELLDDTVELGG